MHKSTEDRVPDAWGSYPYLWSGESSKVTLEEFLEKARIADPKGTRLSADLRHFLVSYGVFFVSVRNRLLFKMTVRNLYVFIFTRES
jgi:hypothetical protein